MNPVTELSALCTKRLTHLLVTQLHIVCERLIYNIIRPTAIAHSPWQSMSRSNHFIKYGTDSSCNPRPVLSDFENLSVNVLVWTQSCAMPCSFHRFKHLHLEKPFGMTFHSVCCATLFCYMSILLTTLKEMLKRFGSKDSVQSSSSDSLEGIPRKPKVYKLVSSSRHLLQIANHYSLDTQSGLFPRQAWDFSGMFLISGPGDFAKMISCLNGSMTYHLYLVYNRPPKDDYEWWSEVPILHVTSILRLHHP